MSWRSRSYEVLPALSVRGPALRQSLRTVTVAWMFGITWMVCCTSGSHVLIYCRMMGFGDFALGLLQAIPFLATFGQIFASMIIERTGLRKYMFVHCATLHRAAFLLLAAAPLVLPRAQPAGEGLAGSSLTVVFILAVLVVSWFANSLAAPAWWTWMGDLIPRRLRGRYLARRERLTLIVQIAVVVTIGIVLDRLTIRQGGKDVAYQPMILWAAAAIFALGALSGVTDIALFRRIREITPPRRQAPEPVIRWDRPAPHGRGPAAMARHHARYVASAFYQLLLDPLSNRVFRHYVLFGATITFSATVSAAYFWAMCLEHMHFGKLGTNMLFQVIGPLASIAFAPVWGKMIDRWGRRPVLVLATSTAMMSILPWFFVTPHLHGPAWLAGAINGLGRLLGAEWLAIGPAAPLGAYLLAAGGCVIGGASWTGIGIAQFGVIMGFSDGSGRSKYVAASSVLTSIGGVLGGLAGGAIARGLAYYNAHPLVAGIFVWNNWHATMAVAVVARAMAVFWLVGMPEPGAATVRDVVRYMRGNVQNAVTNWMFYPMRVFGWSRHRGPGDSGGR